MFKRVLSSVLCLLLMVTAFPFGTLATDGTEAIDLTQCVVTLESETHRYDGQAFTPAVTVTDGETELSIDIDYTVVYPEDTINAGDKEVLVTGMGQYTGNVTLPYTIQPKELTADVVYVNNVTYHPGGVTPELAVLDGETILAESTDYEVAYPETLQVGSATLTVSGIGNYTGTVEKAYTVSAYTLTEDAVSVKGDFTYTGSAIEPEIEVRIDGYLLSSDTDYTVLTESNINVGTATVTVTGVGNYTGQVVKTFDVTQKDINTLMVDAIADQEYTGSAIEPDVVITDGETTLVKDVDYTASYADNTDVGIATVTITGIGNYTAEMSASFNIAPKTIRADWISEVKDQVYTGESIQPAFTVTDGETVLTEDTDYTVSYTDNTNVGTATITVTGMGNYTGEEAVTFDIAQYVLTKENVTLLEQNFVYNGSECKAPVDVIVGEQMLSLDTDYTVTYSEDVVNAGEKTVTVTGVGNFAGEVVLTYIVEAKALTADDVTVDDMVYAPDMDNFTVVVDGLIEDTDYTVAYPDLDGAGEYTIVVTGKGNYQGEVEVIATVARAEVTAEHVTLEQTEFTYTGEPILPVVTVTVDGVEVTDVTLNGENNIDVGTADLTVQVDGKNYVGTVSGLTYTIVPKPMEELTVRLSQSSYFYTGEVCKPTVSVALGETVLEKDVHYTVAYENENAANIGTYTVTVAALDANYTGEVELTYTINRIPLSERIHNFTLMQDGVEVTDTTYTYNGQAQQPQVYFNNANAQGSGFFTIRYSSDSTSVGVKTVEVVAKDDSAYEGSITLTYTINRLDLAKYIQSNDITVDYQLGGVALDEASIVYNGSAFQPQVAIPTLQKGKDADFDYTVVNNVNAGTATIQITGYGNYTGTVSKEFTITQASLSKATIQLASTTYNYNGGQQKPKIQSVSLTGYTMTADDYTVSYKNNTKVGTATLTITGKGNFKGSASTTFTIVQTSLSSLDYAKLVSLSTTVYTYGGAGVQRRPVVTFKGLTDKVDFNRTYINNVNAGTASVILTGKGGYKGMLVINYIIKPKNLTDNSKSVALAKSSYTYTGKAIKPGVTVTVGGVKLAKSGNYTVAYSLNTNTGTGVVAVAGKGNYTGIVMRTFKITKRKLTSGMFTIPKTTYTYTGKAIKPKVTATNCKSSDYTVTYSNNKKYGKATITIKGKGNCTGTIKKTFTIAPKNTSVKLSTSAGKITAKWTKVSGASGYQVYYSTKPKSGYKTFASAKSTTALSYKRTLKKGTTYYFVTRTYRTVNGVKYYSDWSWSSVKSIKCK